MDESYAWLIEYEQDLREQGYSEEEICKMVLEAVK